MKKINNLLILGHLITSNIFMSSCSLFPISISKIDINDPSYTFEITCDAIIFKYPFSKGKIVKYKEQEKQYLINLYNSIADSKYSVHHKSKKAGDINIIYNFEVYKDKNLIAYIRFATIFGDVIVSNVKKYTQLSFDKTRSESFIKLREYMIETFDVAEEGKVVISEKEILK